MLSDKPWKPEAVLFLVAGVFSCLFLTMLANYTLEQLLPSLAPADKKFYQFLLGVVSFQIAPLGLTHLFLRQHDLTWAEFLGLRRTQVRGVLARALVVALLATPVALVLAELSSLVITAIQSRPPAPQPSMQVLEEISHTPGRLAAFSFAAIILAPIMEEILFRGVLYAVIKEQGWPRLALWGSAIVFAVIHGSTLTLVPLTFFAVVLTLLYERTGGLLAPIVTHASFNAANIIFYIKIHNVFGQGTP